MKYELAAKIKRRGDFGGIVARMIVFAALAPQFVSLENFVNVCAFDRRHRRFGGRNDVCYFDRRH